MSEEPQLKTIQINVNGSKQTRVSKSSTGSMSICTEKEKDKRVITQTKKWIFTEEDYSREHQQEFINALHSHLEDNGNLEINPKLKCIQQEIIRKIYGYNSQDAIKNLKNNIAEETITLSHVVSMLMKCNMLCYYCKNPVQIIYENVREPSQWSIERIDNKLGHIKSNSVIACLGCNLRRRTMYHERFAFTKQMRIVKTGDDSNAVD